MSKSARRKDAHEKKFFHIRLNVLPITRGIEIMRQNSGMISVPAAGRSPDLNINAPERSSQFLSDLRQ